MGTDFAQIPHAQYCIRYTVAASNCVVYHLIAVLTRKRALLRYSLSLYVALTEPQYASVNTDVDTVRILNK